MVGVVGTGGSVFEIRLNAALIASAGLFWLSLYAHAPQPVASRADMAHLTQLEDAFARNPENLGALVALSEAYLESSHPQLAVALVRSAPTTLLEEPAVMHQLATA